MTIQQNLFTGKPEPQKIWRSAKVSKDGQERYELRRWWVMRSVRWVAWLMLNPSVANSEKDDPTVRRIIGFSQRWGFDGLIVVNLYPFVSSMPQIALERANYEAHGPDWYARDCLMMNEIVLEEVGRVAELRMVAFGTQPIHDQAWMEQCIEAFDQPPTSPTAENRLCCLGTTKSGMPLHPLARGRHRVPDSREPLLWRQP